MTITFKDYPLETGDYYQEASLNIITQPNQKTLLTIDGHSETGSVIDCYELSKEQLKEFIGALLHVQSKIR